MGELGNKSISSHEKSMLKKANNFPPSMETVGKAFRSSSICGEPN